MWLAGVRAKKTQYRPTLKVHSLNSVFKILPIFIQFQNHIQINLGTHIESKYDSQKLKFHLCVYVYRNELEVMSFYTLLSQTALIKCIQFH